MRERDNGHNESAHAKPGEAVKNIVDQATTRLITQQDISTVEKVALEERQRTSETVDPTEFDKSIKDSQLIIARGVRKESAVDQMNA